MICAGGTTRDTLALLRPLFPAHVAVAATDPRADQPALLPEEAASLPRCVARRRREFAAGRAALRQALAALGEPARPVPMGPDRAPIWPAGLTGSISHCRTACAAILTRTDQAKAVGVDVEDDGPLTPDLFDTLCTPGELRWLGTLPKAARGRMAKLIFSAKECAYKAQYGLTRSLFDFQTLEIGCDVDRGRFEAIFLRDAPPFERGHRIVGRFAAGAGLIVTATTLVA